MAPVKFDEIPKTASEVLGDDYQEKGFSLKTKQKTSFDGAIFSGAFDIGPTKEGIYTPAKLTWKFPKPFGKDFVCIDKLEMDKAGKMKLEVSTDKIAKGLKVVAGSDLVDKTKITASCTYAGIKDTHFKLDTKAMKPQDFVFEVTQAQGPATFGVKCTAATLMKPDVGFRLTHGDFFCSLLAKEKFSVFTAHTCYTPSPPLKLAGTYTYGGKANGAFTFGLAYAVMKGLKVKAKASQDKAVSASVKYDVSKGFTLLGGGKYDAKGAYTYGLQLSIE